MRLAKLLSLDFTLILHIYLWSSTFTKQFQTFSHKFHVFQREHVLTLQCLCRSKRDQPKHIFWVYTTKCHIFVGMFHSSKWRCLKQLHNRGSTLPFCLQCFFISFTLLPNTYVASSAGGRMTGAFTWSSCTTLLEMSTKPVNMRATIATRTGCVRHGMDHKMPFSGRGSMQQKCCRRPTTQHTPAEHRGLTADNISTNLRARDSHQRPSRRSHTPVCMLVTSTANMSTGVTKKHLQTVKAWTPGQHPTTLVYYITQRKQPASSLTDGTSAPNQIWPSRVSARTADCLTDMSYESSPGHNISLPLQRHRIARFRPTAIRWSVGTFARLIGSAFAFSQMNPFRDCHLRTHQTLRGHTRIFVRAYFLQPKNVSRLATGRTMCHAGAKSARPSIAPLPEPQGGLTLIDPLRPYYLGSGRSRSDGRKQ